MFLELFWHDTIIESIQIKRFNPGYEDEIEMFVIWPNGTKNVILFQDVYKASLNLNFGVIADESILKAFILEENDKEFEELKFKWAHLLDDFNSIKCYVFQTASTGSLIKIFAKKFSII